MTTKSVKSIYYNSSNIKDNTYLVTMCTNSISALEDKKYFSGDISNTTIQEDIFDLLYNFVSRVYMYSNLFGNDPTDDTKNLYDVFIHSRAHSVIEFLCKDNVSLIKIYE